jgi:hypothetical protein
MTRNQRIFSFLSRLLYSVAALALSLISLAMIAAAGLDIWRTLGTGDTLKHSLLNGIGLVVVSLAVFDVAKYLMEEEVMRNRELSSVPEARQTLTKFIVIIVIAVTMEALVFILDAGSQDLSLLVYPAILLGVASVMVVALGVYLRLSSNVEQRLGDDTERRVPRAPPRSDVDRLSAKP